MFQRPSSSYGANRARTNRIPPGAMGSASSAASRHPLPSLAAVMSAPERQNMPCLHPGRLNGKLWFGIDDCIRIDIVKAWQSDFWGPWWNYGMVPKSNKDTWWTSFVQKYFWDHERHDQVYARWEEMCQGSIGNLVSKRKRSGKKPEYIGEADWNIMLEAWEEEVNVKRSKTNAENRTSDPDGFGMSCHSGGAKKHIKIAHEMAIEAGGVKPSATAVVRKTHTQKDGTFIDKRAEFLVTSAETLATQRLAESNANSGTESIAVAPSNQQLTVAYLETAVTKRGGIYGLGSTNFLDADPNESSVAALRRNSNVDLQLSEMKNSMNHMKRAVDVLLRINGIDPVTLLPTNMASPTREGVSSAATPTRSESTVGPTPEADPLINRISPINLANVTLQSVEGFFEEEH